MQNKLKTEKFIQRAIKVHGDKYDYSLVDYIRSDNKIKIICKEHGIFEQIPNDHITGHGCKQCAIKKCSSQNSSNTLEFIEETIKLHGDRYDYSLVEYTNSQNKVKIICKEHGIFEQIPARHLSKSGCPTCNGNKKMDTETFIKKSFSIHGDKYDYTLVEYTNCINKVGIICKEHGVFYQSPHKHLLKQGCPTCSTKLIGNRLRSNNDEFIIKAIGLHGNRYDENIEDVLNLHFN